MLLTRSSGIGQDETLISLRRRHRLGIILVTIGGILAVALSASLLLERRGTLLVKADRPDAYVVLNGSQTSLAAGEIIKNLRPDVYSVSVNLPGYVPQPPVQVVKIKSGKLIEVQFSLVPAPPETIATETEPVEGGIVQSGQSQHVEKPAASPDRKSLLRKRQAAKVSANNLTDENVSGTVKVTTNPVPGGIFVDDVFEGLGSVTLTDVKLGEVIVSFGAIEGYRTPDPQKAFLSLDWPYADLEAVYLPLIYVAAHLNQSGRVIANKCKMNQGYVVGELEKLSDPISGPGIKHLDEVGAFVWEIGYAFSNRNPPGQDFVEIVFNLPQNWDGNKPLDLHLYGYGSNNKFPFALAGKSTIDVFVNARKIRENFQPTAKLSDKSSSGPDVLPVNSFLQQGENRIRIQASPSSRCFYYLQQIVLL